MTFYKETLIESLMTVTVTDSYSIIVAMI